MGHIITQERHFFKGFQEDFEENFPSERSNARLFRCVAGL